LQNQRTTENTDAGLQVGEEFITFLETNPWFKAKTKADLQNTFSGPFLRWRQDQAMKKSGRSENDEEARGYVMSTMPYPHGGGFSRVFYYLFKVKYLKFISKDSDAIVYNNFPEKTTQKNTNTSTNRPKRRIKFVTVKENSVAVSSYCYMCDTLLEANETKESHLQSNQHKKKMMEKILKNQTELSQNKGGIEISEVPTILGEKKKGKEKETDGGADQMEGLSAKTAKQTFRWGEKFEEEIVVTNVGKEKRHLRGVVIVPPVESAKITDIADGAVLEPSSSLTLDLAFSAPHANGVVKFVVLFHFDDFQIARYFSVVVVDYNTDGDDGGNAEANSGENDESDGMFSKLESDLLSSLLPSSPFTQSLRISTTSLADNNAVVRAPASLEYGEIVKKLPKYEIPSTLRELVRKAVSGDRKSFFGVSKFLLRTGERGRKLFSLLCIEEIQMEVDIRNYDMQSVNLEPQGKDKYSLFVPGLAEKRPSVLQGDRIYVKVQGSPKEYEGFVYLTSSDKAYLEFHSSFSKNYITGLRCDIRFSFSRTPLRRMYQAIENVPEYLLDPFPIPGDSPLDELPEYLTPYDRKLNKEQELAVASVITGAMGPTPFIIFGPPGTGKTITIVECIKHVYKFGGRVLACAPSNSAADIILLRIMQCTPIQRRDVIRVNAYQRSINSTPKDVLQYSVSDNATFQPPSLESLLEYKVVITTCVTSGMLYGLGLESGHFTHIFIDEAGHALEPEIFIPLSAFSGDKTQIILTGDPRQLGPIVRSPIAKSERFHTSYLERLIDTDMYSKDKNGEYNSTYICKLIHNYRSHPKILQFPSQLFYDGDLIASGDPVVVESFCGWEELPNPQVPIIFHGIIGEDQREGNSPSWFNPLEVMEVLSYVKKITSRKKNPVKPQDIGVVTPYHKQVTKLRKVLSKHFPDVKVGSVEEFQGQEKTAIIISSVRSSSKYVEFDQKYNLGFLKNAKRFNVAITRAKSLLVLIGNPFVLQQDPNWGSFLKYCVENKCYKGCSLPKEKSAQDEEISALYDKLQIAENDDPLEEEFVEGYCKISPTTEQENPEWVIGS